NWPFEEHPADLVSWGEGESSEAADDPAWAGGSGGTGQRGCGNQPDFRREGGCFGLSVTVLLDEPIGTIRPAIYSQLAEHIGGVIYDGIWVGTDSKVPNIGGIR